MSCMLSRKLARCCVDVWCGEVIWATTAAASARAASTLLSSVKMSARHRIPSTCKGDKYTLGTGSYFTMICYVWTVWDFDTYQPIMTWLHVSCNCVPLGPTAASVLLPVASAPPPPQHPPVGSDWGGLQVFAHPSHDIYVIISGGGIKSEPRRQTLTCSTVVKNVSMWVVWLKSQKNAKPGENSLLALL